MMIKDLRAYAYGFLVGVVLAAFVLAVSLLVSRWYIEHEVEELTKHFFVIERLDRLEAAQDPVPAIRSTQQ